ncbi:MAG: hypothetical protein IJO74_05820 [Clostridia bacterium]|nr:hypothetical protein [Clostridia bacterium]
MKKNVIKTLFASLIIFILGIVICIISFIYSKVSNIDLFKNNDVSPGESYEIEISMVEKTGQSTLDKIYISAENTDISILSTEKESYILFENPDSEKTECKIENGILKISDTVPFYFMGLSVKNHKYEFAGFRNIFSQGIYSKTNKKITVFLNKNLPIELINISVGVGDINISDLNIQELTVISSVSGIAITNSDIQNTVSINNKIGNIVFEGCNCIFADINGKIGDIKASASGRKTNCETVLGDISIATENDYTDYSSRASLSYGKIYLNGDINENKQYSNNIESDKSLWTKTSVGNISFYKTVTNE